jgi:hypothetical protein
MEIEFETHTAEVITKSKDIIQETYDFYTKTLQEIIKSFYDMENIS